MDRDRSIIAQNAGTTAANLIGSAVQAGTLAPASLDELTVEFEQLRLAVFNGTLELAGAEMVVETFSGGGGATEPSFDQPAPSGGGGGSKPNADVEVKIGKHKGKTIGQIAAEEPDWLEWAGQNLNNDWLKSRIREFLAA